ncbi:MAG: hypothetical protein ACR2NU_04005, partial [Aeoliella sp.]
EMIAKLPALTTLSVRECDITDDGLAHLAKLTTLNKVSARLTFITDEGVAKLRESLPDVVVEYDE